MQELTEIKFLGIIIDTNLNWSSHISKLRLQLRQLLGLIYLASSCLRTKVLIILYNCLINGKPIYGLEACGSAFITYTNKILIIQKRIIKAIYHKPACFPSSPLFKEADILLIHQLYTLHIYMQAYSVFYNLPHSPSPVYKTRHSNLALPLPPVTSTCGQRQVSYTRWLQSIMLYLAGWESSGVLVSSRWSLSGTCWIL